MFQGQGSLFMDNKNLSYWVNQDQTGFYVFSRHQDVHEAKWVRATHDKPDPQVFEATYAAKINYAEDMLNGYRICDGLYLDLGNGQLQVH